MKTVATLIGVLVLVVAGAAMLGRSTAAPAPPPRVATGLVAAPARVEGRREPIAIGAALDGVLSAVLVHEGDRIAAHQVVARLDCRDLEADVAAAEARLLEATAIRQRLLRGGRDDARAEADARVKSAEARLAHAHRAFERATELFTGDQIIPRAAVDDAERDERVAISDLEAARQHAAVVRADPLTEERAAADAAVASTRSTKAAVAARLARCAIQSPIDGVVLRRHLEPGERVVSWPDRPILTVGDLSSIRVRIELDERDVGAVRVGQRVELAAEALGASRPVAVVSRLSLTMGRRQVQSGDPAEKADRDILEVIANVVDQDSRLVSGLRVTAVFVDR